MRPLALPSTILRVRLTPCQPRSSIARGLEIRDGGDVATVRQRRSELDGFDDIHDEEPFGNPALTGLTAQTLVNSYRVVLQTSRLDRTQSARQPGGRSWR